MTSSKQRPSYDLVLFDMDGTLTEVRSPWEHIHRRLGLWEGLGDGHLAEWLEGRIDYEEFFRLDVALWLGMGRATLFGLLDAIPLGPGAVETLRGLHEGGVGLAILSTGFLRVARRIEEAAGFPLQAWANEMHFDEAGRLERVTMMTSGDEDSPLSKRALIPSILERFETVPERTLAVGDSSGDTSMFGEVGYSLAVHGAPDIGARERLPEPDLRCCLDWVFPGK
ncbi:MAG: HAD-IB family phosphatase [Planctomycetota bacterium]|jgi:phosphoserine phosphatase